MTPRNGSDPEPVRLSIDGVSSGYAEAMVVRNVSLDLRAGEILAVLGKNGMGKSTLLKTVMGFVPARAGDIRLNGRSVAALPPHLIARDAVAYTPQEYTLFQDLTVEENLRLGVTRDRDVHDRLDEIGAAFPVIPKRLKQRAGTLSGGEQKMLLLSRALVAQPKVMLIDEISEGLQPSMVQRMAEVLRGFRDDRGVSILLIEQNLPFALSIADRYAILKLGEVVEEGDARRPGLADMLSDHLKV